MFINSDTAAEIQESLCCGDRSRKPSTAMDARSGNPGLILRNPYQPATAIRTRIIPMAGQTKIARLRRETGGGAGRGP
jgi:hypothetical protein